MQLQSHNTFVGTDIEKLRIYEVLELVNTSEILFGSEILVSTYGTLNKQHRQLNHEVTRQFLVARAVYVWHYVCVIPQNLQTDILCIRASHFG